MRRNYGGTTIDLGDVVYIFDAWAGYPIFHRASLVAGAGAEDGASALVTRCGHRTHNREGGYMAAIALPPKHAIRIGRPCRHCWPNLRRILELDVPAVARG